MSYADLLPVLVVRRRERTHPCGFLIRKLRGSRYQLRVYVGPGSRRRPAPSWSFGSYPTHEAAADARNHLFGLGRYRGKGVWRPGMGPLEALAAGKRAGVVPPATLPRWVVRVPGGYGAAFRTPGGVTRLPGPYPDPATAYYAARLTRPWPDRHPAPVSGPAHEEPAPCR